MTIKIRSLVVSGVCLLGIACSDASPAIDVKKPDVKAPVALPAPKPSFAQEELLALAATSEARPSTILDQPKSNQPEPLALNSEADKSKDGGTKEESVAIAAHEEPIDYSRSIAAADVTLDRFVLATGVEGREPVGESDVFTTETPKIFAFMQVANPDAEPFAFRVHWEPVAGPESTYGVELHVKTAPRFRTWSWTAIPRKPGEYRAVLRTLEGEEIASRQFVIEAAKSE